VKSDDSGATQIARVGADGDTLETLSDQIDGTSTHDAAAVVTATMANTTDGKTLTSILEALMAVLSGVASPSGSTVAFKKRDGATTKVTVTYGASEGQRTASAWDDD
jgi:hypothetical protein